jgi:hypothetical protein
MRTTHIPFPAALMAGMLSAGNATAGGLFLYEVGNEEE